jgi:3-hydroxyisobutyrate dehydrogenase-like beta-hydroxyacid dehydrogenase
MKIGIIGLGRMGSAIARRLIRAGHDVTVYNRTRSRAEPLAAEGVVIADSPASACAGEAIITVLADDDAVEAVVLGDNGVLQGLAKDAVHISMSTITVALSEKLAAAHHAVGQRYLAAPVFGRPDAAAAGKLFIVVGGEADTFARCQPLFDAVGQKTFVIGDIPPWANLVKLGGNFLIASMMESVGEAVVLMRKSGVDPQRFVDIMTGSLFAAPVYRTYGELIVKQRFQPPGFAMPLGLKDIRSVLAAAETQRVPMPAASLVRDHFISGIARGGEELDWSALSRVAAQDAGLSHEH